MTPAPFSPRPGAHVGPNGVHFVAFTDAPSCSVRLYDESDVVLAEHELLPLGDGLFALEVAGVDHGALYRFVVRDRALPDPFARYLPFGVHRPAMVVESKHSWRFGCVSRPLVEHVVYELHVGTFTPEGTYRSAGSKLELLAELGMTTIELMPVAAFDGTRGWGYDGVAHYAPFAPYGTPDDLRALVDRAHGLGLSVLLDVVYNHFGPSGNYLGAYHAGYFTNDRASPWGEGPNFAFPEMRRYVIENALYWLTEFRFDGLRLDATHAMFDASPKHVLEELARSIADLEPKRIVVAEDARNDPMLVTRFGLDALWADDFHHAVRVTLTGERDGYYAAFEPGAATVARAIRRGWIYEGQVNPIGEKPRGAPADELSAENFVYCVQNHDQVGNRAHGDRLHHSASLDAYLCASVLLLFLPMTPLLFMGQEWASSSPFLYFTDHEPELGRKITEGRRREFASFRTFSDDGEGVPDPQALETFERSMLDWTERDMGEHLRVLETYRAALRLRREDPVLCERSRECMRCEVFGEVLAVERWRGDERRLLLVNFGDRTLSAEQISREHTARGARALLTTRPDVRDLSLPGVSALVLALG